MYNRNNLSPTQIRNWSVVCKFFLKISSVYNQVTKKLERKRQMLISLKMFPIQVSGTNGCDVTHW